VVVTSEQGAPAPGRAFSEGPGVCPGQNLVLLTASTFLATLPRARVPRLETRRLEPGQPLPLTFSPYRLRFTWPTD